jgi:hypothetical protein
MEALPPSRRRSTAGNRDVLLPWHRGASSIRAEMLSLPVSPLGASLSRPTPLSSPISPLGGAASPREDRRQFLSDLLAAALEVAQDCHLPPIDHDGQDVGGEDNAQDDRREHEGELPKRQ